MSFARQTKTIELDGHNYEFWVNPPRGKYERSVNGGDSQLLTLLLVGWDLGGEVYEDHVFEDSPSPEEIMELPTDTVTLLAGEGVRAIRDSLPKLNGTGS